MTEGQSRALPDAKRSAVAHELADVFLYLMQLPDKLHLDLIEAAKRKMDRALRAGSVDPLKTRVTLGQMAKVLRGDGMRDDMVVGGIRCPAVSKKDRLPADGSRHSSSARPVIIRSEPHPAFAAFGWRVD